MNKVRIAALYTPLVALLLSTDSPQAADDLTQYLLLRREDTPLKARCEIKIRTFSQPAHYAADQRCPNRVYAWARLQFPAADKRQPEGESWSAMGADFSKENPDFIIRFSSRADFAILLRGILAYQRKVDRRTKKLRAQLVAYHREQLYLRALEVANRPKPSLLDRLRYRAAKKIHRVAVAAEAVLNGIQLNGGEGRTV